MDVERLVEENIKLVYYVFEKLNKNVLIYRNKDDIISEGMIGLYNAAKSFLSDKGSFSTYAYRCIYNSMILYLRREKKHFSNISLETEICDSGDGEPLTLGDVLPDYNGELVDYVILTNGLKELLKMLPAQSRQVIILSMQGCKQREVGKLLGISRSCVSMILKRIKNKMQHCV